MEKKYPGLFTVVDGGEGAGKGTQIRRLQEELAGRDDVVFTREPGGTEGGSRIRDIVLASDIPEWAPEAELMLFLADRAQHMKDVVVPALQAGKIVISDRGEASTVAYQLWGKERRSYFDTFHYLNQLASQGVRPDHYIVLDVNPRVGIPRKRGTGEENRFEAQDYAFHDRVREGLLEHARQFPVFTHIDAHSDGEEVWMQFRTHFFEVLDRLRA